MKQKCNTCEGFGILESGKECKNCDGEGVIYVIKFGYV